MLGLLVLQSSRSGGSQDAPDAPNDMGDAGDTGAGEMGFSLAPVDFSGIDFGEIRSYGSPRFDPISIEISIPDFQMPSIPCGCGEQLDGLYQGISDFGGRIRGA